MKKYLIYIYWGLSVGLGVIVGDLIYNNWQPKPVNTFNCTKPLPEGFTVVYNPDVKKYAIYTGEGYSDEESMSLDNKHQSLFLGNHQYYFSEVGASYISKDISLGNESQFDDSCQAKNFYLLYKTQEDKRIQYEQSLTEKKRKIDSAYTHDHTYILPSNAKFSIFLAHATYSNVKDSVVSDSSRIFGHATDNLSFADDTAILDHGNIEKALKPKKHHKKSSTTIFFGDIQDENTYSPVILPNPTGHDTIGDVIYDSVTNTVTLKDSIQVDLHSWLPILPNPSEDSLNHTVPYDTLPYYLKDNIIIDYKALKKGIKIKRDRLNSKIIPGEGVIITYNGDSSIYISLDSTYHLTRINDLYGDLSTDTIYFPTRPKFPDTLGGWFNQQGKGTWHTDFNDEAAAAFSYTPLKPGDHVFYFSPTQYEIECEGSLMDSYGNLISHVNCYFKGKLFSQNCDPNDKNDKENFPDAFIVGVGSEADCAYGEENLKIYLSKHKK